MKIAIVRTVITREKLMAEDFTPKNKKSRGRLETDD